MSEAHTFSPLIAVMLAYLCGSIPTGVLIARRLGIEVRKAGSGNIGATNVARAAGKKAGLLTLLGDASKGLVPVLVVRFLDLGETALACTAVAALLGHLFSPFLGFSGGKGVATGLGVFLGLAPQVILLALLFFLATFALSRIVSLASLVAAGVTPLLLLALSYPRGHVVAGLVIALLIIARHHENIARLWKGQEPKFSLGKSSSSPAA
ncbi:MAG: glycerol-3-phosphate 1-O-acyltransferase PlsY [Deltaproteobacteria bacterium]|nr:glycerol-3-phosphate 1-O-acyltransferase PlsY [Deltaproteobacteria bacterium]